MWVWVYHVGVGIPCGCGYNMFHWQVELVNPIKWAAKLLLQVKNLLQFTWIAVNVSSKWYPAFDSSLCPPAEVSRRFVGGKGSGWQLAWSFLGQRYRHHHQWWSPPPSPSPSSSSSSSGLLLSGAKTPGDSHLKALPHKTFRSKSISSVGNLANIRWHDVFC